MIGSFWFNSFSSSSTPAATDYELISTTILGSTTASVTFSGLGTSAAAYKHLQIRWTARGDNGNPLAVIGYRLNSDTGFNYAIHALRGNGSTVVSVGYTGYDWGYAGIMASGGASASIFGAGVFDLLDFSSTSKNKVTRALTGNAAPNEIDLKSSVWLNTSATSSINFFSPSSSNFVTGSRFSLYGLKG